ncbi:nucleotidyltransferase domain-containing protein [Mycolicibacterium sp. YH-1]|uniref:nucleotidyltransferase domain-containing protein n=1 Tax=Mycolicibacterium sp. YH-1 TaxID=2908837 RepID=UPI001F4C0135|nr:nucleotidyltransferase domain-containing protein [Mycolicibacterium sp. YH-1]UNB52910.1 nucleotidyltransferase domain-containing protein [Mycolicibacterium sp. YH-1]
MAERGALVAERLVMARFPEARAAWLGGSVAAGEQTSTSDLDITVLLDGPPAPFRSSEVIDGWPVEFFVQTEESLLQFCAQDRGRRRPTTMRLVGSSIILIDRDGSGQRLQAALHQLDLDGPAAATDPDLESQRYAITDMLADLAAARSDDEMLIVAAALTWAVGDFVLAANRRWGGSGKWLLREIVALDRDGDTQYAPSLTDGLRAAAVGDPKRLHGVALAILNEFGGPVFDGFHRSRPPAVVAPETLDRAVGDLKG